MKYRINCSPLRKLIDYIQEKRANIWASNFLNQSIQTEAKKTIHDAYDPNNQNPEQTLCEFAIIGEVYPKNPQLFRPLKVSWLQKIIFPIANGLDKVIVDSI